MRGMATPKPAPSSRAKPAAPAGRPDASKSARSLTAESSASHPGDTLEDNERKSSEGAGELALSELTLWQHAKMAARQKRDKAVEALCALVAPIKALLTGKDKSADDADGNSETAEGAEGAEKPAGDKATLLMRKPLSKRTRIIIAAASVAMISLIGVGLRFALKSPPPLPQPTALEARQALEEEQAATKAKQDAEHKKPAQQGVALEVHQALEEDQAAAKAKQDSEPKKLEQQEVDKSKPALVTQKPASEVAARDRKSGKTVSAPDDPAKPAQPEAGRASNEQGDCNLVGNVKTIGEVLRRCIREFNGEDAR